ncbi:MAG: 3-methylitaconate isomerase [Deltaproteobacteria bacterium]|nr:3-methylitaconate isomerase [Deltaproteobacteria bacterium]
MTMQIRIPAVYMRGGTSKAVFFLKNHLPADPGKRDRVIMACYGSPDPNKRQIDGMGGAVSTTSKVAIISPSTNPAYHVNYHFGQVSVDKPKIGYQGNCGNISSAVGPFAIDQGMVPAEEPITEVRIFQVNTKKLIIAEVPVKDGQYNEDGDHAIDGVPGKGGKITLHFLDPGGAISGKLLPTGNATDVVTVPGLGEIAVSIVDAANPVVFVRARDLGLRGTETHEIDGDTGIRQQLETIRCQGAVMLGLASTPEEAGETSQDVPKIAFVSEPRTYETITGKSIKQEQTDLVARIMSMGALHKAYAVTGAICTAGAAKIEGTVVHEMLREESHGTDEVRLGHPGGIITVGTAMDKDGDTYLYREAIVDRTARRLMDGYVYVPERHFSKIEGKNE